MQHIQSIWQRSAMGQLVYHINSLILCVCVCDRAFSMISPRKSPRSSCFFLSVTSLGGWVSFKPTLEAQLALEVPRPAFRPSFPISHVHRSTTGERGESAFDLGGFWPEIDAVFFASVRIMTPEARFRRGKRRIDSLAPKQSG